MSKDDVRTLVIIDEQFEKIEGHPYEYNKSVAEIFRQKGFEVKIYGHENLLPAIQEELKAIPYFSFKTKSPVRKIPVLGNIIYRRNFWKKYISEFAKLVDELKPDKNYLFFFPNVYWYNILPISKSVRKLNAAAALLYRISIFDALRLPAFMKPVTLRIVRKAVERLRDKNNVHYFSDSEVIAEEWIQHLHAPMRVLPIPHLNFYTYSGKAASDKVRMYLPGGMRLEKGADLLTRAFETLALQQPEVLKKITLVTQFSGNDEVLEAYKKRLAALPLENIFLKHLSTEEYNEQMQMADVILIPYQVSEGYRARTSGILAEAIASSKPFITTDGTWMSLQARKFDTGLIIKDNEPGQLSDALCDIVGNYAHYAEKAERSCQQWVDANSKNVFFEQLMSSFP